jgi:hypothetical protein
MRKINDGEPLCAKAVYVGFFVFHASPLKRTEMGVFPGWLSDFAFCEAEIQSSEVTA